MQRNCFYKDIHIHVLIKTDEGQELKVDYKPHTSSMPNEGNTLYTTCVALSHLAQRLSKTHAESDVFR